MKVCFIPEGDNEVTFIKNIYERNKFGKEARVIDSEYEFIKETATNELLYFIDIPEGVDRIPFRLNDIYENFKESGCEAFVIVCDVEVELGKPSARKLKIEENLESYIQGEDIKYIFSCPYLEEIYWDHFPLIKRVMGIMHQQCFPGDKIPQFEIPDKPPNKYKEKLCDVFIENGLHFKKDIFCPLFFSGLNYFSSLNPTVKRLKTLSRELFRRVV